ncbi:MAG: YdeI/OmpD-associated family protein [Ferruginibacter sp.]
MISFTTTILQFGAQGEKTGWMYIELPIKVSDALKPGVKKSFRVKGKLDDFLIQQVALIPMGEGKFIIPFNATMRKATRKRKGDKIKVSLAVDETVQAISSMLMECLEDEPQAKKYFMKLAPSHRQYYSKWIESAKTDATKTKRVAMAINAFAMNLSYGEMIRMQKEKDKLG